MTAPHPRFEALVERQFTEGLSVEDRGELTAHLRHCAPCQRLYDRFSEAEQVLFAGAEGDVEDWTAGAQARVEAGLLGGAPTPRRSWLAPLALATTAFAATAAGILAVPTGGTQPEVFTPRGTVGAPGPEAERAQVGLRALRVRASAAGPQIADLARDGVRLRADDRVTLLYVNHEGATRVRAWLEAGPDAPPRPLVAARAARDGVEDAPLGDPIPVAGWPSGTLTIVAEFTAADGTALFRRVDVTKEGAP